MTTLNFSSWIKWDNWVSKRDKFKHPGIYALRISEDNIEGQPFEWVEDIVYLGMTCAVTGLKGRLNQFNITLRDNKGGGHGGARRFRYDYEVGQQLAILLYVAICEFKRDANVTPEYLLVNGEVVKAEYVALAVYLNKFKKLPRYNDKKASPKRPES